MADFLDLLAKTAQNTVEEGYYDVEPSSAGSKISLKDSICSCVQNAVLAEIKAASPSGGVICSNLRVEEVASAMERGGAVGISVVTEPKHFKGSMDRLLSTRQHTSLPLLMKDIVTSPTQVDAASKLGADAVLLIQALFDRGYCDGELDDMIGGAHDQRMEVLLETHTRREFEKALNSDADLIGINNRDLATLSVDLHVTQRILASLDCEGRIVVSESGIRTVDDIRFLKSCGARAFLIGSSLLSASDVEGRVREFVEA